MTDSRNVTPLVQASVQGQLAGLSSKPFSEHGFETLENEVATYVGDLVDESVKIARRNRADDVSAVHVQQAAQNLTTRAHQRMYGHVGTIGGIILGAGLSSILSVLVSPPPISTTGFLISIGFTAVGTFIVALSIARL